MEQWSSLTLFAWSCGLSATAALGSLCLSGESLTARRILGVVAFHGSVGGGLGLLVYEKLAFRQGSALAAAIFYGGGIVHSRDIRNVLLRVLESGPKGNSDDQA